MGIEEVAAIMEKIASGLEDAAMKCLDANQGTVYHFVLEQLKAGLDGNEQYLSPTYDDDPYFEERGFWYHRSDAYKAWKRTIIPPVPDRLGFSSRPDNVPNLFIDGTFYGDITVIKQGDMLVILPGTGKGPEIVGKYGEVILDIGPTAVEYFNNTYMLPALDSFFKNCGYR